jgi:hypothetical protein
MFVGSRLMFGWLGDHRITHESSPGIKPKREPESQLM